MKTNRYKLYQEVECDAYYDFETDCVHIKVRRVIKGPDGELRKKGVIFKLTEEMLDWVPEGYQYRVRALDRWEQIVEEIPNSE